MPKLVTYSLIIATASYMICTGSLVWGIILFCGSTAIVPPTQKLNTPLNKQHVNNLIRNLGFSLAIVLVVLLAIYAGLDKDIAWKSLFVPLGVFAIGSAWWNYFQSPDTTTGRPN